MEELIEQLRAFVRERDWEQFHTPRNLATALTVEAAELLEIFQWDRDNESVEDETRKQRVAEELADIGIYALLLADRYGIDFKKAIATKLRMNSEKYPVDKAKGRSTKYIDL